MRFEEQFSPDERELLNEELTDSEVREILDRLSVAELGGSEKATVGAVCEATGVGPMVVGRMLAEIRQTNLHKLFGHRIDRLETTVTDFERRSEERDSRIEATVDELKRVSRQSSHTYHKPTAQDDEYERKLKLEMRKIAEERIGRREAVKRNLREERNTIEATIFVVLAIFVGFILLANNAVRNTPTETPDYGSSTRIFNDVSTSKPSQPLEFTTLPFDRHFTYDPAVNNVVMSLYGGAIRRPATPMEASRAFPAKHADHSAYFKNPPLAKVIDETHKILYFEATNECYVVDLKSLTDRIPTMAEVKEYFPEFVEKVRMAADVAE